MFNLGRVLRFFARFFGDFIPLVLAFFGLAVITEVVSQASQLPGALLSLTFWLGLSLDVIPAILVAAAVFSLAGRFVQSVFGLSSWKEGVGFLMRSRLGQASFKPWMRIEEGRITGDKSGTLSRIGGPGFLIIGNDSAVVLERCGHLTRVEGAGFPKLERFEKVFEIVDLRLKTPDPPYTVSAMTREGIPISWDVVVHYQIGDGGQAPSPKAPYPLSKPDVLRAATAKWVRETTWKHGQDMDWEGRLVIGETEADLRSIVAKFQLNQLIDLVGAAQTARQWIEDELQRRLHAKASALGAKVADVRLGNLRVDDAVSQQWIEAWREQWQGESDKHLAPEEATYLELCRRARRDGQKRLITCIARVLEKLQGDQAVTPPIISVR